MRLPGLAQPQLHVVRNARANGVAAAAAQATAAAAVAQLSRRVLGAGVGLTRTHRGADIAEKRQHPLALLKWRPERQLSQSAAAGLWRSVSDKKVLVDKRTTKRPPLAGSGGRPAAAQRAGGTAQQAVFAIDMEPNAFTITAPKSSS